VTERFHILSDKVGLPPGHAVFTGERRVEEVTCRWIRFGPKGVTQGEALGADDIPPSDPSTRDVLWVNVGGLHDTELIKQIGDRFELHPLAVEDIVSVGGRPLAADYGTHVFTSLKSLSVGQDGSIQSEHITVVFGQAWVLSFQETHGDIFGHVRRRLNDPAARVRSSGADYLWYALLDAIVDQYAVALSHLAERIEDIEDEVWGKELSRDLPMRAQRLRHELLLVRRAVRPLREQLTVLTGDCPALVTPTIEPFLGDLDAHLLQHQDAVDHLRDSVSALLDAHVSVVTMRTNDIIRVLTIMTTIFIPMTFVAGVYGMNFEHMPELAVPWAYPATLGVMIGIAITMLIYFWRKRWL
jgi:magnesium transporter